MSATQSLVEPCRELLERLAEARTRTDEIFALVRPEFLYERPIAERHRVIFYIGHLEAFDWNLLRERLFSARVHKAEWEMPWQDLSARARGLGGTGRSQNRCRRSSLRDVP